LVTKVQGNITSYLPVERVIYHPNYVNGRYYNSIALVKLRNPVKFNTILDKFAQIYYPKLLCLADSSSNTVTDYGTDVDIVSSSICELKNERFPFTYGFTDVFICADTCSVALCNKADDNSPYSLLGLSTTCKGSYPSYAATFIDIRKYLDWIEKIVWP
jgi:hypothetical protein